MSHMVACLSFDLAGAKKTEMGRFIQLNFQFNKHIKASSESNVRISLVCSVKTLCYSRNVQVNRWLLDL